MKTKAKFILKSLADLPANSFALAASVPLRALDLTRRVMAPPVRASRRQVRAAQQRSAQFIRELSARANTPLKTNESWSHGGWSHGGLNE